MENQTVAAQTKISLENGKYELRHDEASGALCAYRYGAPWQDFTGNKFIYLLMQAALAVPEQFAQPAAEWQARVGPKGQWLRIDPTGTGETLEQRVTYLRELKNGAGRRPYEVRALYAAPPPALAKEQGADPTMTRDELVAAAESIGMRRPQPSPAAPQPLTDKQIDGIFDAHKDAPTMSWRYLVTRAIERAHGIGARL